MRIALVTETWLPSLDGVVTRLSHTVTELLARGHEVLVVAPTTGPAREGLVQSLTPGSVVPIIDRRRRWGLPDPAVAATVLGFAPDVVHVVNPVLMGTWAVRRLAGRLPLVVSLHTDLDAYASRYRLGVTRPLLRRLNRSAYGRADLALATSSTGAGLLEGLGVPGATIWPAAVDRRVFGPAAAVEHEPWVDDGSTALEVLCVGRLAREKHHEILRPLVDPARNRGPGVRLTLVGDGPDERRLRGVFEGTSTTFAGRVEGPALARRYRAADVVAFTSPTETVGLVLLEAAALGRPIVAVDSAAARGTLAGYPGARLVADGAPEGDWRSALVSAAGSDVGAWAGPLGWDDATDVLLEAYDAVVERCGPAAP